MLLQDSLRLIDNIKKSGITKAKSKVSDALDIPVQFANKISLTNPKILLIKYAKEIIDIGPINFL